MNASDIIRAWKDAAYRASLSAAQRAALPANPAGMIELSETELDSVVGGAKSTSTAPGSGCGGGGGGGGGTGTGGGTRRTRSCPRK